MNLSPITVKAARKLVRDWHRHLPDIQGGLFATSVVENSVCVGVAIAGNPSRVWQDQAKLVISRVATTGYENACSMLYGALCRAAKALGYREVWTYTFARRTRNVSPRGWLSRYGPDGRRRMVTSIARTIRRKASRAETTLAQNIGRGKTMTTRERLVPLVCKTIWPLARCAWPTCPCGAESLGKVIDAILKAFPDLDRGGERMAQQRRAVDEIIADNEGLTDTVALLEKSQRTPGTVEVCENFDSHDCQYNSHYGAFTPSLCQHIDCPLHRTSARPAQEGGGATPALESDQPPERFQKP